MRPAAVLASRGSGGNANGHGVHKGRYAAGPSKAGAKPMLLRPSFRRARQHNIFVLCAPIVAVQKAGKVLSVALVVVAVVGIGSAIA